MTDRKVIREDEIKDNLIKRANRIEGQIRGIKNMISEDKYCDDILHQIIAVKSALDSVSKLLLKEHMHHCLVHDIKNNKEETMDELLVTIGKLIK